MSPFPVLLRQALPSLQGTVRNFRLLVWHDHQTFLVSPEVFGMASIHGSAHRSDGSKIDGTATVSTSWNSNKAYPRAGHYRLNLGSNPHQTITVYVDGNTYTVVHVDGDTRVDIQLEWRGRRLRPSARSAREEFSDE
jgi:hypothetical protein